MQCQVQQPMEYQYVNPYEMMYRHMNFDIGPAVSRDTAEKVARQLGFMHNAFGLVAKDLIKIISLQFRPDVPPSSQTEEPPREDRKLKQDSRNRKNGHPEPMDVQNRPGIDTGEIIPAREPAQVEVEGEKEAVGGGERQEEVISQDSDRIPRPPNSDIFNEFSYKQSGLPESKNPAKDHFDSIFKEKLSKIVEEVAGKSKKSQFVPNVKEQDEVRELCERVESGAAQEERKDMQAEVRQEDNAEEKPESAFLQEYEYNPSSKKDSKSNSPEPIQAEEPSNPPESESNRNPLRSVLQQPYQQEIYEISDDD